MRKKLVPTIIFSMITALGILYILSNNSVQVITYFPLDELTSYENAATSLDINSENKSTYAIDWTSQSKSEQEIYLRQDVSVLYVNGKLIGIRSKWEQNTDTIRLNQQLQYNVDAYWEAISYHHGEIHHPEDSIRSIQQMTSDQLYVYKRGDNGVQSFRIPKTKQEEFKKEKLDKERKQQLLKHWQGLTSHFSIDTTQYDMIPLTELYKYEESLPGLSKEASAKVIGQLWEGLYKNYIIPITDSENVTSYIPLLLMDKEKTHLYVLFELNGEKEQLIQKISTN
ncbi:hypothetical protein GMD78_01760 [Ornithinibacillus sp. L9]|uniref:Uncharacterized protein n=1 Tax=Ornithinibacillus caprae TaxID=2678566 RepID=A0A6N8FFU0_9BACI|nr:hypothetical protein [Ornithinibacillus caprae]MUK87124.1 hypothetical protein [Ornithinibacillus caprae]